MNNEPTNKNHLAAAVVIGTMINLLGQDHRIQEMLEANGREKFIEGCDQPWFKQLMGQALIQIREAV